jgi:hypothetical protein
MRISRTLKLFAAAAVLLSATIAPHAARAAGPPPPAASAGGEDAAPSFEKFLLGADRHDGVFPVIVKDGKVYLELRTDQFDRDYYEHATTANGIGGFGLLSGDDFQQEARIVHFVRVDDKHVALVWPHQRFKAAPGTPAATAIRASTADSVQAVTSVVAEDKAGGRVAIDLSFLLGDQLDLGNGLSTIVENPKNPEGGYRLDPTRTYFGPAKAFPKNDLIEVDQTFASAKPDVIDTVVDPHSIQMRVKYNFAEILSTPGYVPRLVDDRVGFWNITRVDFDNDSQLDRNQRYVTRWNLQAVDPTKPSPAKHPLVYTLTNTIPLEYRAPIREALLEWNKAFEKIGILNAIQVQDQPSDPNWDPDDIRYNTIRWLTEANGGGFAEAQIEWDPRTGEIFRSGVLIDADIMRFGNTVYTDPIPVSHLLGGDPAAAASPEKAVDPALWDPAKLDPADYTTAVRPRVHYGVGLHADRGAAQEARFGALALQSYEGNLPAGFAHDFLKSIVLHEAGHDFGLAHNFVGHDAFTAAQLKDKNFTQKNGVASSVMEYSPINLWPKGTPQGDYWQTTLGPYDYHVIHWGYAPVAGAASPEQEVPTLNHWSAASADPRYRFASDEDVEWNGHAIDPRTAQFMLTNNPPAWCDTELSIYRSMIGNMDSRTPRAQQPWDAQRFAFSVLLNEYNRCAGSMTHYIGGEYLNRGRVGDTGVKTALSPVPRSLEVTAYHDLDRYLFSESAWNISPATLQRTVYTEYEPIENFGYDPAPRHDLSLTAIVGGYQTRALLYMFSPLVLQRLVDLPSKSRPGETMTTADLFAWTQTSIFGDLQNGRMPKTAIRRNLQRTYSRLLARLAVSPFPGTPYDAQALARLELTSLAGDLRKNLMRGDLDLQTRAHLEAMQVDTNRALDTRSFIPVI